MKEFFDFLAGLLPPYPQIFEVSAFSGAVILAGGGLAGSLKRHVGWKTGYTRKVLHFIIFFSAAALHLWGGMPAVNVLGVGMGVFVLLAVKAGSGNFFFEAMARRNFLYLINPFIVFTGWERTAFARKCRPYSLKRLRREKSQVLIPKKETESRYSVRRPILISLGFFQKAFFSPRSKVRPWSEMVYPKLAEWSEEGTPVCMEDSISA